MNSFTVLPEDIGNYYGAVDSGIAYVIKRNPAIPQLLVGDVINIFKETGVLLYSSFKEYSDPRPNLWKKFHNRLKDS